MQTGISSVSSFYERWLSNEKEIGMPVYTNNDFIGRWPVGSAAVVAADTPERAAELLSAELARIGLRQTVQASDMTPFDSGQESVAILCDGDY
jgi:hypothetical protein